MRRSFASNAVAVVAGGLVVALFCVLFAQILLRTFARPLIWAEEFSTFAFIWLVFAGAALTYLKREHLEVDLFHDWASRRLGRGAMRIWDTLVIALQLVFLCVFCAGLVLMTRQSWALFAGSLPGFRFGWIYLGVLIAVVISMAILLVQIVLRLRDSNVGQREP